jgi:arylformamidase
MLSLRPLFSLQRGGHEEVCVCGEVALLEGARGHERAADGGSRLLSRSLLKPFQFLATGLAGAALEPRRVPALGSISATAEQIAELRRWYGAELERDAPHLALPSALPLCPESRAVVRREGPSPLFHPCFAKHMAVLAACREQGWPIARYTALDHPYHRRLLQVLAELLGRSQFEVELDGCGLATPALALGELAELYRALAAAAPSSAPGRVAEAMRAYPEWIGGPDRVDTRLMQLNPGRLIAKEGADGLLAVGVCPSAAAPAGAALVVKLASGYQPEWAALAAQPFLEALGLMPLDIPTHGQRVVWHTLPQRAAPAPIDISPLVSERVAVWPGDTAFSRTPLTMPGSTAGEGAPDWELLVSAIRTTVHVGAHADAPNHFEIGEVGIDRVPLAPYRGRCQVLDVNLPRGATITVDAVAGRLLGAPRLLFKTGSFPDPDRFNEDFVAFAPELIEWVAERGVVLVGIDTPSVDPFSSKTLPSHHATRRGRGLAILEGLSLAHVAPGLYELIALPLRLEGADASPVRAALWPLR